MAQSWTEIHKRFASLSKKTGTNKIGSYSLDIGFNLDGDISIHMFTYDISDWNRHTYLGPFKSMGEAKEAVNRKIDEAFAAVDADIADGWKP